MFLVSKTSVARAAALALSLSGPFLVTSANATAVAQSNLAVSNFKIQQGNGALGGGAALILGGQGSGAPVEVNFANNTGQTSAALTGYTTGSSNTSVSAFPVGGAFSLTDCVGVGCPGSYTPTSLQTLTANGQYTGSHASLLGSALLGGATSLTDDTIELIGNGVGAGQSNTGLNAEVGLTLATSQLFQVSFNATGYLFAGLDPDAAVPGSSTSVGFDWVMEILDSDGNSVAEWSPSGSAGNGTGTEFADAFDLTQSRSRLSLGQALYNSSIANPASNYFEWEVELDPGTYTVSVRTGSRANAELAVPEPGSLALVGAALAGLGYASRRRRV